MPFLQNQDPVIDAAYRTNSADGREILPGSKVHRSMALKAAT